MNRTARGQRSERRSPARVARALRAFILPGALLLVPLFAASCGYQHNGEYSEDVNKPRGYQWRSLYREDYRTVAVPIFTNRTYNRGLEFTLSKAVVNQIEARTPYKVVDRDRADTILEGEVESVSEQTISEGGLNAIPQEQLMIVRVNFTWKDLHTGRILVQRRDFEQTSTWYPTLGEGQFVGSQNSVEKLAVAIVHELEAEW